MRLFTRLDISAKCTIYIRGETRGSVCIQNKPQRPQWQPFLQRFWISLNSLWSPVNLATCLFSKSFPSLSGINGIRDFYLFPSETSFLPVHRWTPSSALFAPLGSHVFRRPIATGPRHMQSRQLPRAKKSRWRYFHKKCVLTFNSFRFFTLKAIFNYNYLLLTFNNSVQRNSLTGSSLGFYVGWTVEWGQRAPNVCSAQDPASSAHFAPLGSHVLHRPLLSLHLVITCYVVHHRALQHAPLNRSIARDITTVIYTASNINYALRQVLQHPLNEFRDRQIERWKQDEWWYLNYFIYANEKSPWQSPYVPDRAGNCIHEPEDIQLFVNHTHRRRQSFSQHYKIH